MQKNRFLFHPIQAAPSMSPSHSYTIVPPDDGDDSDICPVCDGECTCQPPIPAINPGLPLSMAELSRRYAAGASSSSPAPSPPKPSLKIKLTVPPSMLAKRRLAYSNSPETTSDYAVVGYNSPLDSPPRPAPKKRGRPPKHLPPVPPHYKPLNPKSAAPGKQHKRSSSAKVRQNLKARASVVKKASRKKRPAVTSDEDESSSEESVLDHDAHMVPYTRPPYIEDGTLFPTFVSASALSSLSSDNSDGSLSDFDSDSSLVKEEENFILADVHDKARLKRELLGGDDPLLRKRSSRNSDWVVRPRKKSVGPSDAEMDVDTDATEDDDDDDENPEEDDDETEEDTVMMAVPPSQEEEEEDTDRGRRYVGLATGWSEDEESSFDADLFFANLSDNDSSSDSDCPCPLQPAFSLGEDGDQSDISCTSDCTEGSFGRRRAALESLPFEVTEGWDGQIVFTNGIHDNQGIIDIEFEADASRFVVETSASPSRNGDDDDTDAPPYGFRSDGSDVDMSDGGYEEEDGEGELGEGDTTDEELVGEDDLPNERAMRLFSLPMSVSAINPLSTVSTPNVSPGRRRREDEASRERMIRRWGGEGVSASDILQGKVLFWDSDEMEEEEEGGRVKCEGGESKRVPMGPRKGVFVPTTETRQAVIGEDRKGDHVPSPHPRFNRGRGRTMGGPGRFSSVEHLLRRHLLQSLTSSPSSVLGCPSSVVVTTGSVPSNTDDRSPLELLLSSAAAVAAVSGSAPEDVVNAAVTVSESVGVVGLGLSSEAEPIELGDVLEASFLDDPDTAKESIPSYEEGAASSPAANVADEAGVKNLSRWDLISVGAFRQSRENGGHLHTPHSSADFGSVIKSSPLSAVLWQNANAAGVASSSSSGGVAVGSGGARQAGAGASAMIKGKGSKLAKRRRIMMGGGGSAMSSPLILPLGSSSSPTASTSTSLAAYKPSSSIQHQHQQKNQNQNRKESRRERKLLKKRSGFGTPLHAPHLAHSHHGHQFHAHHQHHPNAKMRSVSSSQRGGGFFGGAGGVPPPLNL
ncbi:hypothetical protein CPB84DRAFT_1815638 [Gymnopilus junonius]|uniref:Uncharacterized protein n=1 Tax=Gymnopilus junonius TaxID=109634 RepID=A0A9P5TMX4_GYMJU|nr:hypothetical protein CPB84DRAFT_1815638 [Gymnopilus junonius]